MDKEMYKQNVRDLQENDEQLYHALRTTYQIVPKVFQAASTNELTTSQLYDVANNDTEFDISIRNSDLKKAAEAYDEIGIISSEIDTFSREKVFRSPSYNGRGYSISWDEIVETVETVIMELEMEDKIAEIDRCQTEFSDFELEF